MGQNEHGAALHELFERVLDHRFVFGVDRGERFVEHQDRRIAQQGAGDGDALALAAREAQAPLADHGAVALRQAPDEVMRVGGTRGRLDLRRARAGLAEADILFRAAVEEIGVLMDHGELRP